ncbi:hypothetical protein HD806DRAFT_496344 [Xylariaceae sp. AK1471]|nr:hypothetical protein HD806DRAFT_496344 [Xylariaceae sp. AK1471]
MVGVPGRSKGCSTCRRRKKGCDRKRPICTQCSIAGLECGGYERERVFLNHNQCTTANSVNVVYRKGPAGTGRAPRSVADIALPHRLTQTAYVEKYISIFLSKYLPTGRALSVNYSASSHDWIEIAHRLHTSERGIQLSLLSLGLFAAGEPEYALQSYSRALSKLQAALYNICRAQYDSALATCKLLSLFEVFHGSDDDALSQGSKWHSHLRGQLAIIQARSPYEYQSGVSHQLFADGRYPLLVSAIKDRRRFPLNTPEWRSIPWEHVPKSPRDKLYDIFADLTEILADTDQMRCCDDPVQRTDMRSDVVKACWGLDKSLQNWLKEAGPLKEFHDANGMLVDHTESDDFVLAHMTLLYWTIYIVLYSTLISIYDPSQPDAPPDVDPRSYIRKIAKALPYFWSPGAGMSSANLAALPWGMCLHITYTAPHRYQEETALMEQLIGQPSVADTVLGFLNSLHRTTARPEMAHISGKKGMILRAQSWMMGKR